MAKYFEKRNPDYGSRRLYAVDSTGRPSSERNKAAYITYYEGGFRPNFENKDGNKGYGISSDWYRTRKEHIDHLSDERGNPTTLFHTVPPHVSELFADPSMRPHVATLLGRVLSRAQMLGTTVESSEDLSPHSSRLVKRGISAGLVTGDPANSEGKVTNNINYESIYATPDMLIEDYDYQEIPEEEVREFRKVGRDAIRKASGRAPKPKTIATPKPQGEQLKFDI